jgi:hypothetical protein
LLEADSVRGLPKEEDGEVRVVDWEVGLVTVAVDQGEFEVLQLEVPLFLSEFAYCWR